MDAFKLRRQVHELKTSLYKVELALDRWHAGKEQVVVAVKAALADAFDLAEHVYGSEFARRFMEARDGCEAKKPDEVVGNLEGWEPAEASYPEGSLVLHVVVPGPRVKGWGLERVVIKRAS